MYQVVNFWISFLFFLHLLPVLTCHMPGIFFLSHTWFMKLEFLQRQNEAYSWQSLIPYIYHPVLLPPSNKFGMRVFNCDKIWKRLQRKNIQKLKFGKNLYLGLEKKRKFLTKKTKLKHEKTRKKRKFVRGKARFVEPTYSALSLRSIFHKKAPVNRD